MLIEPLGADERADLIATARGLAPADTVITNGRVVNVYSDEICRLDVLVRHGRIAALVPPGSAVEEAGEIVDADGGYVLPGYVEPHCHPWALYHPDTLARTVLPLGTTSVVGELLNLQLLLQPEAVGDVYGELQRAPLRWYWAVRVTGQSHQDLDATFPVAAVDHLLDQPGVVQIAEITAWPDVLDAHPALLERMALARRHGLRLDGHTAGATPQKLAALAAAGFTADHEAITASEALERLRNGFHVILRHSSLRPDLDELLGLVAEQRGSARLSLTTDGSGPSWIARHGFVDGMVRQLVGNGIPIPRAVAMATLNPATYLRLDEDQGGLAPGRVADLQVLADFDGLPPETVMVGGQTVARRGELTATWPDWHWQPHFATTDRLRRDVVFDPQSYRPPGHPGREAPAMQLVSAGIARAGTVLPGADGWPPSAVLAVLFERSGQRRSWAWIDSFAPDLHGLATSYTTSGDFLVLGRDPEAMALAARHAFAQAGGIAVVRGGSVVASLDLDIGGSMSSLPMEKLTTRWQSVEDEVKRAGYGFDELLYCLAFITCDFLPDLRLVADGLLEVKTRRILVPAEPC